MGLKERIENLEGTPGMPAEHCEGYFDAIEDAAQIAAEADELMAEMVKALAGLAPDQLTDDQALNVTRALDWYNKYKEAT